MTTQTQSLIAQIEDRFQTVGQPVRYISADEMAYLRARAVTLRSEASLAFFQTIGTKLAGLFRSRTAEWSPAGAVTAK